MELASTPRCVCHMKGMEVPSVKPLGQAPMGMEGASCGEHERESCLRTGLEGTFMPFVLPCLKSLKSSEGGEGSFVEVGGGGVPCVSTQNGHLRTSARKPPSLPSSLRSRNG